MKKENTIMKKVLAMLMAALMVAAMFTGCSCVTTAAAVSGLPSLTRPVPGRTSHIGLPKLLTAGGSFSLMDLDMVLFLSLHFSSMSRTIAASKFYYL